MNRKTQTKYRIGILFFIIIFVCLSSSCSKRLGYGVLLWSTGEPPIPSGTVLPVYIRSNINQVWVAGIPLNYRNRESKTNKFEIPLAKLELAGSKRKAERRAAEFAPYALSYAETLQDGLPIREFPDNNARRVYRLRQGEIIKILTPAHNGIEVLGGDGEPLPGGWFRVLTENGTTGYCYSYRLAMFEYEGGTLASATHDVIEDPELDMLLSRTWVAEAYASMLYSGQVNLDEFSLGWGFDPGQDSGIARINTKDVNKSFSYTAIRSTGTRSWRFEGAPLQMNLRSDTTLAVQFTESGGVLRTVLFATLPTSVGDIIVQESARRDELFNMIRSQGSQYSSHSHGTLTFNEGGSFIWTGFDLLVPQVIPASAIGSGRVDMGLFLSDNLINRYDGALTLRFNSAGNSRPSVDFMYSLDSEGLRLEYIPDTSRDGIVVSRRATFPMVLYFSRTDAQVFRPPETSPFTPTPFAPPPFIPEEEEPVPDDDFDSFFFDDYPEMNNSYDPEFPSLQMPTLDGFF